LRPPPDTAHAPAGTTAAAPTPPVLGWPPNLVFATLAFAAFLCCVTMSMPQAHMVAMCTDYGIPASSGALMLTVLLGVGFLTRQLWGVISDRIGGLLTLLASSLAQCTAMTGFLLTQDEIGLFAVSGAFGVAFSGLVPAYVLAVREYYPASEASWRVPAVLLMSGSGMAAGSWLAGVMYDHYGYYMPAFAAGIGANLLNVLIIATLVTRQQWTAGPPQRGVPAGAIQPAA
jgi:nitrate/nitrite transporter NarK